MQFHDLLAKRAVEKTMKILNEKFPERLWLPPHVIDLHEDGYIDPHIDSVKFSGDVVAGLSLLASSTMRLAEADETTGDTIEGGTSFDFTLEPRSLYVLAGPARFKFAHSIFGISQRRVSVIFRDEKTELEFFIKKRW